MKIFYIVMAAMLLYLAGYCAVCYHLYFRPRQAKTEHMRFAGSFSLAQAMEQLALLSPIRR